MGRFHRHNDGTEHDHDHGADAHDHDHGTEHDHDRGADAHDHDHGADGHDHAEHSHAHTHVGFAHEHPHSHADEHAHEHHQLSGYEHHDHRDHEREVGGDTDPDSAEGHRTDLGDHSGYVTGVERVVVLERIFGENDFAAAANRARFDAAGVVCLNLMSSPGAGKTSLLQHTLVNLRDRGIRAGVVEGDIETSIDADRLSGLGAQISLLNTANGFGGECHLDAPMVARALAGLDLETLDVLLIENVGNLVCPAEFDVGAHRSAMVYAITEGEEKPLKYPVMFHSVDAVVVNKMDLLPHLDFDLELFEANVRKVNPAAEIFRVSARTGEGIEAWEEWLVADGVAAH